ncbi:hypothetical protein BDB00DRAFT_786122 [Zychaea mexicana]|uniref:uncharacterized protein n=1 Tax=Zychaea mexicana TaxID=64656 RepID=UPI0022FE9333|nr:uncharacterized protein BDB00DRAFT_786122 [Zychaea mexicana]KAI9495589.1 hypothetical protein BDB00DRAFT_786122 [Zychaea mexicana]
MLELVQKTLGIRVEAAPDTISDNASTSTIMPPRRPFPTSRASPKTGILKRRRIASPTSADITGSGSAEATTGAAAVVASSSNTRRKKTTIATAKKARMQQPPPPKNSEGIPYVFINHPRCASGLSLRKAYIYDFFAAIESLSDVPATREELLKFVHGLVQEAVDKIRNAATAEQKIQPWRCQDKDVRRSAVQDVVQKGINHEPSIPFDKCEKNWIAYQWVLKGWHKYAERERKSREAEWIQQEQFLEEEEEQEEQRVMNRDQQLQQEQLLQQQLGQLEQELSNVIKNKHISKGTSTKATIRQGNNQHEQQDLDMLPTTSAISDSLSAGGKEDSTDQEDHKQQQQRRQRRAPIVVPASEPLPSGNGDGDDDNKSNSNELAVPSEDMRARDVVTIWIQSRIEQTLMSITNSQQEIDEILGVSEDINNSSNSMPIAVENCLGKDDDGSAGTAMVEAATPDICESNLGRRRRLNTSKLKLIMAVMEDQGKPIHRVFVNDGILRRLQIRIVRAREAAAAAAANEPSSSSSSSEEGNSSRCSSGDETDK